MSSVNPVLAQANYGEGKLAVYWTPISGSTYFVTQVYQGTTPVDGAKAVTQGFSALITPQPALSDSENYTVQTAQSDASGNPTSAFSQPFNVLQNPVTDVSAAVNSDNIVVSWTLPAYGNPEGANVTLMQSGNATPLATVSGTGTSATIPLSAPLDSSQTYTVAVVPFSDNGGSTGPETELTLIVERPTIYEVTYDLQTQEVQAYSAPPYPAGVVVTITVTKNGTQIATGTGRSNQSAEAELEASTLDAAASYQATLRYSDGNSYGPQSTPVAIVISQPVVNTLSWQGSDISVNWTPLPNPIVPTGGEIALLGDGDALTTSTVQGYSGSVMVPASPTHNTYQIGVSSLYGLSEGPLSELITIPSEKPTIATVSMAGQTATVSWAGISGAPGYQVLIEDSGGQVIASLATQATTAAVSLPLASDNNYTASVQQYGLVSGAQVAGPAADSVAVIPLAPEITQCVIDSGSLNVTWNTISDAATLGITGFALGLFDPETGVALSAAVTVSGGDKTTGSISTLPDAGIPAVVKVWATGSKTTGPQSEAVAVVFDAPLLSSLAADTSGVTVLWSAVAGASGYSVTYTSGGHSTTTPVAIPSIALPADASAISVLATNGVANGPAVDAPAPITAAPVIGAVANDGVAGVTVDWAAISGAPGYKIAIKDSGGEIILSQPTQATAAALALLLDDAESYTAIVQQSGMTNGVSVVGHASDSVSVIPLAPEITQCVIDSSSLNVTWNTISDAATFGITGFSLGLFDPETGVALSAAVTVSGGDKTTGSISTLPDSGIPAVVKVWATGAKTTGPQSAPVTVVFDAPSVTSVIAKTSGVTVQWAAVASASGYSVTYTSGGNPTTTPVAAPSIALPADATAISVLATNGVANGPATAAPAPGTDAPTISSVASSEAGLTVTWGAVANAPGYQVSIVDSGSVVVASIDTAATSATLAVALDASQTYSAIVCVYTDSGGLVQSGHDSAAVAIVAATPVTTAVGLNGSDLQVQWQAIDSAANLGISGYSLAYIDPQTEQVQGSVVTVSGATATQGNLPLPDDDKQYAAVVWATGTDAQGNRSLPVTVIAAAPTVIAADISASNVTVSWTPISWPEISRYKITLYEQGQFASGVVAYSTTTEAVIPNTLTASQTLVQVQAVNDLGEGPLSTAVSLYGSTPSYYPQPVSNSDNTPTIVRSATNQPAAYDIELALPDIFKSNANVTVPITEGAFTLDDSGNATYPYKITIPSNSVAWQFDAASRTTLFSNFNDFLKALETQNSAVVIQDGALTMVRQILALALPLLYSETLLYMLGFDPNNSTGGYVDLYPGMQLVIANEAYQFSEPGGQQNGYVGSGSSLGQLHSYFESSANTTKIGFDAFLSLMQRPQVPAVTNGGAGIIDLYAPTGRRAYYRLFLPRNFPSVIDTGQEDVSNRAVIVGADTFASLSDATDDYEQNGNFDNSPTVYPLFLRGRAVPTPKLPVRINGQTQFVAVGTTVAGLFETMNRLPQCQTVAVDGFTYRRALCDLIDLANVSSVSKRAVQSSRIRLDLAATVFSPGALSALDLPVFPGDELQVDED